MKNFKNLPIGETFEMDGETYKVVKDQACCKGCVFNREECSYYKRPFCTDGLRDDGTNVVFIKVEQ